MRSVTICPSNLALACGSQIRTFSAGQLVKYHCNTIHGRGVESGTIKRFLNEYTAEIKRQLGGYVLIDPRDII